MDCKKDFCPPLGIQGRNNEYRIEPTHTHTRDNIHACSRRKTCREQEHGMHGYQERNSGQPVFDEAYSRAPLLITDNQQTLGIRTAVQC